MTEEIVAIKIIPDSMSGGSSGGSGNAGGNLMGNMTSFGSMLKGVLTGIGIASVVGLLAKIVSVNTGLMSVVGTLLKMLGMLLKPITDVIMILLMPILMVLRPIVILLNQVMRPFLELAMQMMKEGAQKQAEGDMAGALGLFAGAGAVMLQGLSAVIVALATELLALVAGVLIDLQSEFLQVIIGVLGTLFAPILGFFGMSAEEINEGISGLQDAVQTGSDAFKDHTQGVIRGIGATAIAFISSNAAAIAETFGTETDSFRLSASDMIKNVFGVEEGGLANTIDSVLGIMKPFVEEKITGTITGADGFQGTMETQLDSFKQSGVSKIKEVVDAFNGAMNFSRPSRGQIIAGGFAAGGIPGAIIATIATNNYDSPE